MGPYTGSPRVPSSVMHSVMRDTRTDTRPTDVRTGRNAPWPVRSQTHATQYGVMSRAFVRVRANLSDALFRKSLVCALLGARRLAVTARLQQSVCGRTGDQSHATLIRDVLIGPLHEHGKAIAKAGEIQNVDE